MEIQIMNEKVVLAQVENDYISDDEYQEFLKFIEEYNKKKDDKRNNSLLYQIYKKFIEK